MFKYSHQSQEDVVNVPSSVSQLTSTNENHNCTTIALVPVSMHLLEHLKLAIELTKGFTFEIT